MSARKVNITAQIMPTVKITTEDTTASVSVDMREMDQHVKVCKNLHNMLKQIIPLVCICSVSSRVTIGTSIVAGLVLAIVLLNLIAIGGIYLSRRAKRVRIRVIFEQSPE